MEIGFTAAYAPAPESVPEGLVKKCYGHFIGGAFTPFKEQGAFATMNPASGETLAQLSAGTAEDVDQAVAAARKAYEGIWGQMSGAKRGQYLFRIARLLQERAKEFAILESLDGGKPIRESRDVDVPLAAAHFFYHAGWADKLEYVVPGRQVASVGVCAQIIPWNFPLLMAAWKLAPALAAGNTVVLKPAETSSLTALLLAEVLEEAQLPPGVVNIVTGDGRTGGLMVDHPGVQKIAFTGSTAVGRMIAAKAGAKGKRLTLELGGKSAQIVFADAAFDEAVEGVIQGIYFNQGHVCCAGSRLLLEEAVLEPFLKRLQARIGQLRVGNPLDKNTDIGAIHSPAQWQRIQDLVEQGKQEGGEYWQGPQSLPDKGYFHRPCYFNLQAASSTINRVEVFGPVLSVSSFRTPDEAVNKANDTPYGLACGIWTQKASKMEAIAQKVRAGVVWANTYNKFDATAPFGGFKESGYGREGGRHGLLPYLEVCS